MFWLLIVIQPRSATRIDRRHSIPSIGRPIAWLRKGLRIHASRRRCLRMGELDVESGESGGVDGDPCTDHTMSHESGLGVVIGRLASAHHGAFQHRGAGSMSIKLHEDRSLSSSSLHLLPSRTFPSYPCDTSAAQFNYPGTFRINLPSPPQMCPSPTELAAPSPVPRSIPRVARPINSPPSYGVLSTTRLFFESV